MLVTTIRTVVHAQWETIWELLLGRIEKPQRYQPLIEYSKVIDRGPKWVIREMKVQDSIIRERITFDTAEKSIHSELLEHPQYEGTVTTRLVPTATQNPMAPVHLECDFKLEQKPGPLEGTVKTDKEMLSSLNEEMELIKKKAEELEK